MSTTSALFESQFEGRCAECNTKFSEGDDIGYIEDHDKPVCESCWSDNDDYYVDNTPNPDYEDYVRSVK